MRFCEVTQYLRDPALAPIVQALADGQNTAMVYHHLWPRFEDKPGAVVPPGATKLHVFAKIVIGTTGMHRPVRPL